MGSCFLKARRGRAASLVLAGALLAVLLGIAAQAASASDPPCPSCPLRVPPVPGVPGGTGNGGTSGARPVQPLISLGSISVVNGVATVTGAVTASVSANVSVSINAAPIRVSVGGAFSATVDLDAHPAIVVRAGDRSNGQTYTITVPAAAVPAGGVAADALAQLDADAVTLLVPGEGLTIVDGIDISARVRVKAIAGIAGLSLNGVDLLAKLRIGGSPKGGSSGGSGPGSSPGQPGPTPTPPPASNPPCRHTAEAKVSGTAENVTLTVTGSNGASQTTTMPVTRISSVIRIGRLVSVSAFGARGIRITAVRFDTRKVARTHRVAVTVVVRDRRNYLVRDAVVMLQPTRHRASIAGSSAGMSDSLGRARLTVPVSARILGHRLFVTVVARTPRAHASLVRSTLLRPGA